jgi:tripartite-type tricarboxylate transporter receptor subunit TctC
MNKRHFLTAAGAISLSAASRSQTKRPIRWIVPFGPGGSTDLTARALAEPLAKILGTPVIVENKGGAGGSLGMTEVAKAAPDGHTFGVATMSTHGVNPAVYQKLSYDAQTDFTPVQELVKAPGVMVVHPSLPSNSFPEFLAYLKANPGKLSFASPGSGTIGHLWGELFKKSTQSFMIHVGYRGAAGALNDLIGNNVQVSFDQVASSLPHVNAGRIKALAIIGEQALEALKGVPTFKSLGLAELSTPSWFGLVAPKGLPASMLSQMNAALKQVLEDPAVINRLSAQALFPSDSNPTKFAEQIRGEIAKMKQVAQYAKISLE